MLHQTQYITYIPKQWTNLIWHTKPLNKMKASSTLEIFPWLLGAYGIFCLLLNAMHTCPCTHRCLEAKKNKTKKTVSMSSSSSVFTCVNKLLFWPMKFIYTHVLDVPICVAHIYKHFFLKKRCCQKERHLGGMAKRPVCMRLHLCSRQQTSHILEKKKFFLPCI